MTATVLLDVSDLAKRYGDTAIFEGVFLSVAATRQLAKRQLTWLRSMPQRHRVACDAADATAQVVALATRLMQTAPAAAPAPA